MCIVRLAIIGLSFLMLAGPSKADPAAANLSTSSPFAGAPETGPSPVASAAEALPVPDATQIQALMQMFEHLHTQQQQLQAQTRAQMLAALSAPHRALVANLLGQLAVAPNPDQAAIVRQLDATLAPNEQQAILHVSAAALAQAQAIAQTMQSQIQSQMTPEQRSAMQQQFAKMKADMQHLTPEQRAAMERQAAQWRTTMGPPVLSGMYGAQIGMAQDAGSILVRMLTMPAMTPFVFSTHLNTGGG